MPLKQATQTALENNPNLQRTEREIQIAENSLKAARGQKGVSISASGSANAAKAESTDDSENVAGRLTGSMPLYSGKKLESQIDKAEIGIDVAKLDFLQAKDDLIYQVATAYVDALENLATAKVNLETEKNLSDHEQNISELYDAGAKAKIDLLRAQIETSNAHQDSAKSHAAYEVSLTNLATLMSLNSISNLTVEDVKTYAGFDELEHYITLAENNRADLKADALKIDQSELDVEIAKSGKRPTISANVGTGLGAYSRRWHVEPDISAGVSASWNIFDSGITRSEIDSANVELERTKLNMQNDLNSVHEEVITAYKNLKIALMRIKSTQRAVELAEEERFIATEKYRAGEGILLDVLDAEVALATAKKNNVSAIYDVTRYRFALAHATGNTLAALYN